MLDILKRLFGPGEDLSSKIKEGAIIVDVRTQSEYSSGHVKGSKNIPLDKLNSQMDKIKKWDKTIITCCASGMRSGTAASILKNNGLDAYNGGSWRSVNNL